MSETEVTCRLCMSTETLTDLFKIDGDTTLDQKVQFCIDLKMSVRDGLPVLICRSCEKNIKKFYNFKQKCLYVDSKLKTMNNCSFTANKHIPEEPNLDNIKMECELFNKLSSELHNSFDSWLPDEVGAEFCSQYFNNSSFFKTEDTKPTLEQTNELKTNNSKMQIIKKTKQKRKNVSSYKIHQCEICGRIVKNKSVLTKHMVTHSGIKQYSCKLCSKSFTRAEHKVIHMRTHLGIKPYVCEFCGRSFTKRQDLVRHMKIHSDERKFKCLQCDKRFKRSSDVHSHMRTHT
ncbi:hypothetical protein MSG28_002423, partial [Choristoneura fumiferana]